MTASRHTHVRHAWPARVHRVLVPALAVLLAACSNGSATDSATADGGDADSANEEQTEGEVASDARQVRLAILTGEGHPYMAGATAFEESVEQLTGGSLDVQIFADAQLGGEADYLELVRTGGLELGEFVMAIPASTLDEPLLATLGLPFLYSDAESMHRAWDSPAVQEALQVFPEEHGFECIGLWDTGFRQLTSNKPIESVDDLQGLNIRVPEGELYVDTWEALGATPTAMAIPELYSALETGIVGATDIPFVAIDSLKYYEVQSHGAETNYMDDPVCFGASTQFLDSLSADEREAVREAGRVSSEAAQQAAIDSAQASIEKLEAQGMTFTEPDIDAMRAAIEPVYENFYAQAGEEARALVDAIRAAMG
jgi:tripartite ATP-independent transporter DctP family solute receptor